MFITEQRAAAPCAYIDRTGSNLSPPPRTPTLKKITFGFGFAFRNRTPPCLPKWPKKKTPCGGFEWAFCHGSGLNLPAGDGLLCASSTPPSAGTTWRRPGPRPVVRGREPARSKAGGGANEVVVRQDGHEGVKRSLTARAPRSAMAGCAASSHRWRRMRWRPRRRRGRRRLSTAARAARIFSASFFGVSFGAEHLEPLETLSGLESARTISPEQRCVNFRTRPAAWAAYRQDWQGGCRSRSRLRSRRRPRCRSRRRLRSRGSRGRRQERQARGERVHRRCAGAQRAPRRRGRRTGARRTARVGEGCGVSQVEGRSGGRGGGQARRLRRRRQGPRQLRASAAIQRGRWPSSTTRPWPSTT